MHDEAAIPKRMHNGGEGQAQYSPQEHNQASELRSLGSLGRTRQIVATEEEGSKSTRTAPTAQGMFNEGHRLLSVAHRMLSVAERMRQPMAEQTPEAFFQLQRDLRDLGYPVS